MDFARNLECLCRLPYAFSVRSLAAEFPCDNPTLHAGTTWMSDEVCGEARPLFSFPPPPAFREASPTIGAPVMKGGEEVIEPIELIEPMDEDDSDIEIV